MTKRSIISAFIFTLLLAGSAAASETEWLLANAQLMLGRGQASDAYNLLIDARSRAPDDPRLGYLAGVAAERSGRYDKAIELLEALPPEVSTRIPDYRLTLGRTLHLAGENERALEQLRTYTSRRPQDALGFLWLGETLLALGQRAEGLDALKRAASPEPAVRPVFHYTQGALNFADNPPEAVREFEAALESGKRGPFAEQIRSFIDLAQRRDELERWYNVDAAIGFQHDTNMLLNNDNDAARYGGQRLIFAASAWARPEVGDDFFLAFGADINHGQTVSAKIPDGDTRQTSDFNFGSYSLFVDGALYLPQDTYSLEPGLEYAFHYGTLADETHDLTHSVYPRLLIYHSPRTASKLYGIFQYQDLSDVAAVAPLDSFDSGFVYGGGVAGYWVLDDRLDAFGAFAEYVVKDVSDVELGGGQPWHGPRVGLNGRLNLVAGLYADAGVFGAYRMYTENDVRPADVLVTGDAGLGYLLFSHLEIDVSAGYSRNLAEDPYAYDRFLAGVFVRGIF